MRAAVDELVAAAANAAASPRDILPQAEFVITPRELFARAPVGLPTPQVYVQLAGKGDDGLFAGARESEGAFQSIPSSRFAGLTGYHP